MRHAVLECLAREITQELGIEGMQARKMSKYPQRQKDPRVIPEKKISNMQVTSKLWWYDPTYIILQLTYIPMAYLLIIDILFRIPLKICLALDITKGVKCFWNKDVSILERLKEVLQNKSSLHTQAVMFW